MSRNMHPYECIYNLYLYEYLTSDMQLIPCRINTTQHNRPSCNTALLTLIMNLERVRNTDHLFCWLNARYDEIAFIHVTVEITFQFYTQTANTLNYSLLTRKIIRHSRNS